MQKYYSILTNTGLKMFSDAAVNNKKINFVNIVYGDGGGSYVTPAAYQTKLVNKIGTIPINSLEQDKSSPNIITVKGIIPAIEGGFTIREVGIEDDMGNLIAVGNLPDTEKLLTNEGICSEFELIIKIIVTNTDCVCLKIDPNIITATKADLSYLAPKRKSYIVPIPASGWSGNPPYTQKVNVDNMVNDGLPLYDLWEYSESAAEDYAKLTKLETFKNFIEVTAHLDKPTNNFKIRI